MFKHLTGLSFVADNHQHICRRRHHYHHRRYHMTFILITKGVKSALKTTFKK